MSPSGHVMQRWEWNMNTVTLNFDHQNQLMLQILRIFSHFEKLNIFLSLTQSRHLCQSEGIMTTARSAAGAEAYTSTNTNKLSKEITTLVLNKKIWSIL